MRGAEHAMPVGDRLRTIVIAHVYYPEMWAELSACIRNLGEADLVVTYVDESAVAAARREFPDARFVGCENRGYDVWPFLSALKTVDLARYDLVVKLHTKRDIVRSHPFRMNGTALNGSAWREKLLSFAGTPEAWRRTRACFDDPTVGMVAARELVFGRTEGGKNWFDAARRELREKFAICAGRRAHFVGGTMFAVRAAALRPFVEFPFSPDMFTVSGSHDPATYAHVMERLFGLAVEGQGYRVAGFDGSVFRWRFRRAVLRFLFDNRWSERRHSIRICGITVYLRRLA